MILLRHEIEAISIDDFDDMVIAVIQMRQLRVGYQDLEIHTPRWLLEKLRDAEAELKYRQRASKERRRDELKMLREGLKTRGEKAADADDELEKLEAELAG